MTREQQRKILDTYSMIDSVEKCDEWINDTLSVLFLDNTLIHNIEMFDEWDLCFLNCRSNKEMSIIAESIYNFVQQVY